MVEGNNEKAPTFAENKYFHIVKYPMILSGTWPPNLIKPKILQKPYALYSILTKIIFGLYCACEFVEVPLIWNENFSLVADILKMFILYLVTGIKIFLYSSKLLDNLITTIVLQQRKILNSGDADIMRIYLDSSKHAVLINTYYSGFSAIVLLLFNFVSFMQCIVLFDPNLVGEDKQRPLPLPAWMPFDSNKYYNIAFLFSMFCGEFGAFYYVVMQSIFVGLIVYITGQLKILQHFFKNINKYAERIQQDHNISFDESIFITWRLCIIEHNKIINYVKELDSKIKYIILLEFLVNSLQLATLLFTITTEEINVGLSFTVLYLILMINQLFILYLHANEIIFQSLALADIVWESNWLEQPEKVRKLIPLILLRAQKPLKLSIGPFYTMSADTAVMTLKASYTYIMLIQESRK